MEETIYPNLQIICRLCLQENADISIFPMNDDSNKFTTLSIPMRIMTCSALEVKPTDGLPSKICVECRLQLEKSYYFRKKSQWSDAKLRKHIRLVGMDKKSKVFVKKTEEDDDYDDEWEFKDTLDFIKEQEEEKKRHEQIHLDGLMNELKLQNEQELKKSKDALIIKCTEELKPRITEEVTKTLRVEIQKELEETMRKQIKEECLKEAKESLHNEIREECRQLEMQSLLKDLQTYLKEKTINNVRINKVSLTPKIIPLSPKPNNTPPAKKTCFDSKSMNLVINHHQNGDQTRKGMKEEFILCDNSTEYVDEVNANEEETDSDDNFLLYDIDDGFDVEKKSGNNKANDSDNIVAGTEEGDDYIDSNTIAYISGDEQIDTIEECERTSTTSYHIEDSENGEIKFLKKSDENLMTDDDNIDQINDGIMIINFPEQIEQSSMDIGELVEDYDKDVKSITLKKESSSKTNKSQNNSNKSSVTSSTFTTTSTTLETTFLTKLYTNPLQRITDTPKIYKCDDCPMVFSTKPSLERHLRSHRKVERTGVTYKCPVCQIVVSCSSALRRHMFIHCEEKPFTCNECGKAFVQKEILKRHMQTHTGIKPHQCPHCDKAFAQRINLTQHVNRNHLENPCIQQHPCHLCPKRFNHASGLSRHLAAHSGVAFQCSECDRTFGDRSSIKRHIATKHGNGKVPKSETK